MAWLQLLAVALAAPLGWRIGAWLRRGWRWFSAAILCGVILVGSFFGHRIIRLSFVNPISWLIDPRINPILLSVSLTLLMSLVVRRLPHPRTRRLVTAMTVALLIYAAVWPLALSLAVRPSLAHIQTHFDAHNVCMQSRTYTCGPAAAVTCLRILQVRGDEGQIALESQCRPPAGIEGPTLAAAISRLYASAGITAEYRWINSPEALPLPSIACMTTAGGHDVAVLHVGPHDVLVGNPSRGLQVIPRADFEAAWTGAAVVLRANPP